MYSNQVDISYGHTLDKSFAVKPKNYEKIVRMKTDQSTPLLNKIMCGISLYPDSFCLVKIATFTHSVISLFDLQVTPSHIFQSGPIHGGLGRRA